MSTREIIKEGNIILRLKADEVKVFDNELHTLLDDMYETMIKAQGVGLAAPQIGISKRVIIVSTNPEERIEVINPEIVKFSGMQVGLEGCLSVDPSKNGNVKRPLKVTVKGYDREGNKILVKAKDFTARALCHEIDHLNGVLFIDKLEPNIE
ncbi:MAG: peptide deformylase [Christensenellales bacterium]|jgi:peptide deformylase|nr:peptide deformylase [Clostridiales bacterium]